MITFHFDSIFSFRIPTALIFHFQALIALELNYDLIMIISFSLLSSSSSNSIFIRPTLFSWSVSCLTSLLCTTLGISYYERLYL